MRPYSASPCTAPFSLHGKYNVDMLILVPPAAVSFRKCSCGQRLSNSACSYSQGHLQQAIASPHPSSTRYSAHISWPGATIMCIQHRAQNPWANSCRASETVLLAATPAKEQVKNLKASAVPRTPTAKSRNSCLDSTFTCRACLRWSSVGKGSCARASTWPAQTNRSHRVSLPASAEPKKGLFRTARWVGFHGHPSNSSTWQYWT